MPTWDSLKPCRGILRIYSWNVRGCRTADFDTFLGDLENDLSWSILLLQEFTASRFHERFESSAGHLVFLAPPIEGSRACCIVIHASIAHKVIPGSFTHRARGVAVALHWEGFNLYLISYHMTPDYSRELYEQAFTDLHLLTLGQNIGERFRSTTFASKDLLSQPFYRIIGVDAQVPIGPPLTHLQSNFIGKATAGARSWKGARFLEYAMDYDLKFVNTFAKDTIDTHTCFHDFRTEATQMDYMLADIPWRACHGQGVKMSDATRSDHRPVFLNLLGRWLQPRRKWINRTPPPPIGWICRDDSFCDQIRADFQWPPLVAPPYPLGSRRNLH